MQVNTVCEWSLCLTANRFCLTATQWKVQFTYSRSLKLAHRAVDINTITDTYCYAFSIAVWHEVNVPYLWIKKDNNYLPTSIYTRVFLDS